MLPRMRVANPFFSASMGAADFRKGRLSLSIVDLLTVDSDGPIYEQQVFQSISPILSDCELKPHRTPGRLQPDRFCRAEVFACSLWLT